MDFGRMPIANGFLTEEEFEDEYFYNLAIGQCTDCLMVQLVDFVPPEKLFHDKYPFYTDSSDRMVKHFEDWAYEIKAELAHYRDPLVVELGCNDGTMLQHFVGKLRHVGVEPAMNMAEVARQRGCGVFPTFFNEETAAMIASLDSRAQIIYGANVFPHIPDLHSVMRGIELLLAHDGLLIIEEPYWPDIVSGGAFDQIYDEHYYYFNLCSLEKLCGQYGLMCINAVHYPVHGGSMRYTFTPEERPLPSAYTYRVRARELQTLPNLRVFRKRVNDTVDELENVIWKRGRAVVGYGATSKSTTLLNYAGIGSEHLDYIYDTTPDKIGKFSPGMHIPIRDHKYFAEDNPDYALLLAWNHKDEIAAKEWDWLSKGGKFIEYVPEVKVSSCNTSQQPSG
jgi:methylation protein EvaC